MHDEISRRHALRQLGLGAVVCPVCLALGAKAGLAEAGDAGAHWSYEGEAGPEHWGELQPDFKVCELGFEQTPIDLRNGVRAELASVQPLFIGRPIGSISA